MRASVFATASLDEASPRANDSASRVATTVALSQELIVRIEIIYKKHAGWSVREVQGKRNELRAGEKR
jgi:hypothetical protein